MEVKGGVSRENGKVSYDALQKVFLNIMYMVIKMANFELLL